MRARHILLAVIYSASILLTFEIAGRANFFSHHHLSFWSPASHLAYRFYPNLKPIAEQPDGPQPRILVLGGSTLNRGWSDFEVRLHDQLAAEMGTEVQVLNTSMPARTSLDAYYKYWWLRRRHFDLVVLYNSINELRANNVPDDIWRDDYSHYAWYDEANFFFTHTGWCRGGLVLPFYVKHLWVAFDRKWLNKGRKVPYNSVEIRPDWLSYGASIKTAGPYRRNLERMVDLAREKREPVLLMTFAYAIAPNYSLERLQRGELGYDRSHPPSPMEVWGTAEHIDRGLRAHNAIIQDVARASGTFFVDQQGSLGGEITNFIDVCHLSPAGTERFVANIVDELRRRGFTRRAP